MNATLPLAAFCFGALFHTKTFVLLLVEFPPRWSIGVPTDQPSAR